MHRNPILTLVYLCLLILIVGLIPTKNQVLADPSEHVPVTLCHATSSDTNPYVQITVDDDAVFRQGHDQHDHQGRTDIIPPFTSSDGQLYPGKNWDSTGQSIWNNGCNPVPTLTPTPNPTLIPTSVPTPTPIFVEQTITLIPTPTPTLTLFPTDIVVDPTATLTPTLTPAPSPTSPPVADTSVSTNNPSSAATPTSSPTPTTKKPITKKYLTNNFGVGGGNYNPLVDGIRLSFHGSVLGTTTLAQTGTTDDQPRAKLPSGNTLLPDTFLSIPKLKLNTQVYQGNTLGHELIVGDQEVLSINFNHSILLYGHNQMSVFGRLHQLQPGDLVNLTQSGQSKAYQINSVTLIADTDLASLSQLTSNQIYLLTCSYLQPDKRWLVIATQI